MCIETWIYKRKIYKANFEVIMHLCSGLYSIFYSHLCKIPYFIPDTLYFHDIVIAFHNPVSIPLAESRYFWLNTRQKCQRRL